MLGQVLLFQNDRCPVRDGRHPRHADLDRLRTIGGAGEAEPHTPASASFKRRMIFLPVPPGLRVDGKLLVARKIVEGPLILASVS